jgi:hypothetical protein
MKPCTKHGLLSATLVTLALSSPIAPAQDTKPAPAKPGAMQPGMGMMDDKMMAQMQERMKLMQAQMERMRKATDAAERRKLMQEHMQTMHEGMNMMRGMGGGMMMGMMGGKPGGMGHGMAGGDPKQRQEMMEKRMDMMQMMMEQMMQHQQMMMQSAPAK